MELIGALATGEEAGTVHAAGEGSVILNIVDRRTNQFRWKILDAVVEPTWHDNTCQNSDQAEHDTREPSYAARKNVSVMDALAWAISLAVPVTLYLYDQGSDVVTADWPALQRITNRHTTDAARLRTTHATTLDGAVDIASPVHGSKDSDAPGAQVPRPHAF